VTSTPPFPEVLAALSDSVGAAIQVDISQMSAFAKNTL